MRFWLDLAAVEALGRHGRLTVEPKDLATARNGYEEIKVHRVLPSGSMVPRIQGRLNFTEIRLATVKKSLHRSCRTELTRQGILLP